MLRYRLEDAFVAPYARLPSPFDVLGEVTFRRTYARLVDAPPEGGAPRPERWHETVRRVVEGCFSLLVEHCEAREVPLDAGETARHARRMYDLVFRMKFLPAGRGLWAMGTRAVHERGLAAALYNCAFVSTADMRSDPVAPFEFAMDALMLGVGIGFDTKGAGMPLPERDPAEPATVHVVEDSREGWVTSVAALLAEFWVAGAGRVSGFDYSPVRPAGSRLKTFGGTSSGPEPLRKLHAALRATLEAAAARGDVLESRTIVDVNNLVAQCVVSGNIRRSAEIALGDEDDEQFAALKDYERFPERAAYGWTSNNSVLVSCGADYARYVDTICRNGEPGFLWLDNARAYSRMGDPRDDKDARASGTNPCGEQTLESYELCCLVETCPARHETLAEFLETLRYAFMFVKVVTLAPLHWPRAEPIRKRNRRVGVSLTGVAQFCGLRTVGELRRWCDAGYAYLADEDRRLSRRLGIPESIKRTSVKPSGTVSLLARQTPGVHYPVARDYIRRVTLSKRSPLVYPLARAGYRLEESATQPETSCVVEIPVALALGVRTVAEVSLWEQVALAALLQDVWADNQVSCTATFDPATEGPQLARVLDLFQYRLKSISFLPRVDLGCTYAQLPYEPCSHAEIVARKAALAAVDWSEPRRRAGEPAPWSRRPPVAASPWRLLRYLVGRALQWWAPAASPGAAVLGGKPFPEEFDGPGEDGAAPAPYGGDETPGALCDPSPFASGFCDGDSCTARTG